MTSNIIYVKCFNEGVGIGEFFTEISKYPSISQKFMCARLNETHIKDTLREYIVEHGISSLFHFTITCDAVLHPGIHVDDIEKVVLGFIRKLAGVEDLMVIDPYFYSTEQSCVDLFGRMVAELSRSLKSVTFITNGKADNRKAAMHEVLRKIAPTIDVRDVVTDQFHDRFWIDPAKNTGIVMGTSLNGVGRKIALIDLLGRADAKEIARLAHQLIGAKA